MLVPAPGHYRPVGCRSSPAIRRSGEPSRSHFRVRRGEQFVDLDGAFLRVFRGGCRGDDGRFRTSQWRLGELLHATPLRPGEYIWAKFAAVLAGCLIILGIHLAAMVFFNHVLPNAEAQEIRGPFSAPTISSPHCCSRYR